MKHIKIKQTLTIFLLVIFGYLMIANFLIMVVGQETGLLFHYEERAGRTWAAWVMSDVDGDGKREIGISGAIYTKCLDLSGNEVWKQGYLHHEVQWGSDSGIDANDDGITEQLAFEAVWNNHYLLDGKTGVALEGGGEEDRRAGLYWPNIDCGFGLETNVNGKGHEDYVITGIEVWGGVRPVVRCLESDNASLIWEYTLSTVSNGVRPITVNGSQHILVISSNMTLLTTQGAPVWSRTADPWSNAIIPNAGGAISDGIITGGGGGISLINASDNMVLWTAPHDIWTIDYCGDVNNDGIGDFGGVWSSGLKTGLFNGTNGALIRNHSAQVLENYMHGITYCGDLDSDGYDDYGIYGDFALHEVFSGKNGSQLLAITGAEFAGAEEMYLVEDVNNNSAPDIMLFNGGITIIDGTTLGQVNFPRGGNGGDGISGFSIIFTLIGLLGIGGWLFLIKQKSKIA
jgi:hypothetical protein